MRILPGLPIVALLLLLVACGSDVRDADGAKAVTSDGEVGEPSSQNRAQVLEAPPQPLARESTVDQEGLVDTRLEQMVENATQDLATRLTAKPEVIKVIEARYVTWSDSSLGCPRPDFSYMQVLTPGVLIVLQHGETSYHYHGSIDGPPFFCAQPRKPVDGDAGEITY